ncbi:amphiphysin isoform X10 [Dermacentor albipictus]|uniref:amphiphysin isoform X10 n=1 Tax=Dermacentor albipictus TaxID=60249 RepID=UPI0038FC1922
MADSKGGSFTKVVQKHAGRAKERILQNLGRADKTKDEVFEVYLYNFTRQQTAAAKLQKEFKNYVLCIKSLQLASKALMDTLSEIYEQEWVGHEQIPVKAQTLELLWDDYHRKMNDQVMIPLNSYITQFADVRGRIAKRGRKLVDYDKCRHSVESLRNSAKKKDDYKLGKAREELEDAKQMYEVINNELHEELPALYENRIPFLVSNLQTFFTAESTFHAESAQVFSFLVDTMQKLATESERQGTTVGPYPLPNSVSKEADTRPYEEIEFKKVSLELPTDCKTPGQHLSAASLGQHRFPSNTCDVIQVLGLGRPGPKFGVKRRRTKTELLTVVLQVSRRETKGEEQTFTVSTHYHTLSLIVHNFQQNACCRT